MKAPSKTLIRNPESECSELLDVSFRSFASLRTFLVWVRVHLIVKNAKTVETEKKYKTNEDSTQFPGFELALLCKLLASRAGNLRDPPSEKETFLTWF